MFYPCQARGPEGLSVSCGVHVRCRLRHLQGVAGQEVAGVWMTGVFECEVRRVRVVHIEHLVGAIP